MAPPDRSDCCNGRLAVLVMPGEEPLAVAERLSIALLALGIADMCSLEHDEDVPPRVGFTLDLELSGVRTALLPRTFALLALLMRGVERLDWLPDQEQPSGQRASRG
jgi:hypothetical protein